MCLLAVCSYLHNDLWLNAHRKLENLLFAIFSVSATKRFRLVCGISLTWPLREGTHCDFAAGYILLVLNYNGYNVLGSSKNSDLVIKQPIEHFLLRRFLLHQKKETLKIARKRAILYEL